MNTAATARVSAGMRAGASGVLPCQSATATVGGTVPGAPFASGASTVKRDGSAWRWFRLGVWLVLLLGIGVLIAPTRFGGFMTYAVVTGHSMEPVMHDGSLAVARSRGSYDLGDTVIYDRYGGHVMHRLVFYEPGHGWVTQGDNNDWVDGWFVPEQNIRGEVIFTIPAVGRLAA